MRRWSQRLLWALEGFVLPLAIAAGILSALLFAQILYASSTQDQDLQRQLDRIERQLETFRQLIQENTNEDVRSRISGFSRLSAVEREVELNRLGILAVGVPLLVNLALTGLVYNRQRRGSNNSGR